MINGLVVDNDGNKFWYKNDKLHRDDDLPAYIGNNGMQEWYKNGTLDRDNDKPSMVYPDGRQIWHKNGMRHRETGAAIVCPDSKKEYWMQGNRITEEEFLRRTQNAEKIQKDFDKIKNILTEAPTS